MPCQEGLSRVVREWSRKLLEVIPGLPLNRCDEFADIPVLGITIPFCRMRVPKRLKTRGVFEKVGNSRLVDTTAHEINHLKSLTVATIRVFGCDCYGGVTHGYAAGAAERPHVRQGQEGNRFIQVKSVVGS